MRAALSYESLVGGLCWLTISSLLNADSISESIEFARPDPRDGAGERDCAQHDRHDRRGAVHYHAAGGYGDGRAAGIAGMGGRCAVSSVRRTGVRGVGFDVSWIRRLLSIPERDLRAAEMGTADFVSVHLAALLQRSTLDCQRMPWACGLRCVLLAEPGKGIRSAHSGIAHPLGGPAASKLDCDAGNCVRNRYLLLHGYVALSANHGDCAAVEDLMVRRNGDDRMDHLRRSPAFQRRARL